MPSAPLAPLLIGSCEPFSGKSAVVLGLARQLRERGLPIAFGKPLATAFSEPSAGEESASTPSTGLLDADVRFVGDILRLPAEQLLPSLQELRADSAHRRLVSGDLTPGDPFTELQELLSQDSGRLVLLEAAGTLSEGLLFGLGLVQMARALQA
ncbi:MAG: hypothetical protein ACKO0M_10550, partial [Cyanobium sp.]